MSIPLILITLIFFTNNAFDLQLHDTYIVVSWFYIAILFSMMSALIGFIYWIMRKYKMLRILTLAHTFLSIVSIIGVLITIIIQQNISIGQFKEFSFLNTISTNLILLFILTQLVFIFNIAIGLLRGKI